MTDYVFDPNNINLLIEGFIAKIKENLPASAITPAVLNKYFSIALQPPVNENYSLDVLKAFKYILENNLITEEVIASNNLKLGKVMTKEKEIQFFLEGVKQHGWIKFKKELSKKELKEELKSFLNSSHLTNNMRKLAKEAYDSL